MDAETRKQKILDIINELKQDLMNISNKNY